MDCGIVQQPPAAFSSSIPLDILALSTAWDVQCLHFDSFCRKRRNPDAFVECACNAHCTNRGSICLLDIPRITHTLSNQVDDIGHIDRQRAV